ncbi:transketolase [Alphaproteobacteria bacterium]|nr:transketolase [Alphaproteobacteria bacterium]
MKKDNRANSEQLAEWAKVIRKDVVQMVARHGQGYVQQGLGAADLFTYLYFQELRFDKTDLEWSDRDRFILSTAHNTAVFYATLARAGLMDPNRLSDYCLDGNSLEINASERLAPLVECTCGSLGQGLSVAAGIAMGVKRQQRDSNIYLMLGDGELEEGQVWEAAIFAATHKLSNLIMIIDLNYMQVEGDVRDVATIDPLDAKFRDFGWQTTVIDGHNFEDIFSSFEAAKKDTVRPSCIIANTIPGKGVPFLEGKKSHNMVLPERAALDALNCLEAKHD